MSGFTVPLSTLRKISPTILFVFVSFAHAQIVSVSPRQNAIHVPAATSVFVTFGEAMNAASINDTTFRVWGAQSGLHKGAITYDAEAKRATLFPAQPFAPGEPATVMLTAAMRTLANQPLAPFGWSFVTAADTAAGRFHHRTDYATAGKASSVCAGDWDADGDLDLAIATSADQKLAILTNRGNGTFVQDENYSLASEPHALCAADLDDDLDLDIAITNYSGSVSILMNNGSGKFSLYKTLTVGQNPRGIVAADLDGDGDVDLVTANQANHNVFVLKNNGNASFQARQNYPAGYGAYAVAAADLDGDGDLDLATANLGRTISLLMNNGNGVFAVPQNYANSEGPNSIFLADIDGDYDVDIVTAQQHYGTVSVWKNNGDGSLQARKSYAVSGKPRVVFCADLDGDGDLDLVTANGAPTLSALMNNGNGLFQTRQNYAVSGQAYSVFAADLNGDGALDLAAANYDAKTVSVLLNPDLVTTTISHLDFPPTYLGKAQERSFWVYNYGLTAATFADVLTNHPNFKVASGKPSTLARGDSARIIVRYEPTAAISDTGKVMIYPNNFRSIEVGLFGKGLPPAPSISASPGVLDFGNMTTNKISDLSLTIHNNGVLDLSLAGITNSNPSFALAGSALLTIPPGEKKALFVRFMPVLLGKHTDTLSVFSNDPAHSPLRIPMSGVGTATILPEISIRTVQVNFDSVIASLSKTASLLVHNLGASKLNITGLTSNNAAFAVASATPLTLAPGDSEEVKLVFTPRNVGPQTGLLTIASNDANESALQISMRGTGKAVPSPGLTRIAPTAGARLQKLAVKFYGSNFFPSLTKVNVGANVVVSSVIVHGSDSLTANITLGANAPTGPQNFYLTNSGPGGGNSPARQFSITNPAPSLAGITPASGNRLQRLNVKFRGANFINGVTKVNAGADLVVNSLTFHNSDSMQANVTITAKAATGGHKFSVTNSGPGGGVSTAHDFNVNNPAPLLTRVTPNTATRGQKLNVGFKGGNFIDDVTRVNMGPDIQLDQLTVNSADSLTAKITIGATATRGAREVSLFNDAPGGGASAAKVFRIINNVPQPPRLLLPAHQAVVELHHSPLPIAFKWRNALDGDVADTLKYTLSLFGPDLILSSLVIRDTSLAWNIMSRVRLATQYKWTVKVHDGSVSVASPDTFTFRTSTTVAVAEPRANAIPAAFALEQNYPNPFFRNTKGSTTIKYALPRASEVVLKVYDLSGREVATLAHGRKSAGYYDATWEGKDGKGHALPSGVYWLRLEAGDFVQVRKLTVMQ
jgi:hypothetical protein